ncbi:MAG: hypothetical protein V2A73_06665 [Pseudomonadota bacterium]
MRCLFVHSARFSCRPSRILAAAVLVVTLVHGSVAATAAENEKDDWSKSFDPKTVASGIPVGESSDLALVVVAAGPVSLSVEAAASALEQALRASGRPKLVMDDAGLGSMESLDDAAIVARCSYLPITHVAVVRVFPGQPGQATQAVVTFYAKAGEAVTALAVAEGGAVASTPATGAGTGVPASTLDAVSAVLKARRPGFKPPDGATAKAHYEHGYVGFGEQEVNGVGQADVPYRGKQRAPLPGIAFYEAIGRSDLAAIYRSQQTTRRLLGVGAVIGAAWGGVFFLLALAQQCDDGWYYESSKQCEARRDELQVLGGTGLVIGALAGLSAAATDPNPVSASERRLLAQKHNRMLRERLGLPAEDAVAGRAGKKGAASTASAPGSTAVGSGSGTNSSDGGSDSGSSSSGGLGDGTGVRLSAEVIVLPGGGGLVISGVF